LDTQEIRSVSAQVTPEISDLAKGILLNLWAAFAWGTAIGFPLASMTIYIAYLHQKKQPSRRTRPARCNAATPTFVVALLRREGSG